MIAEHYARRWRSAGLLDDAGLERILAWEQSHRRPVWLWAVAGMGALAISLGVLAVIGANWEDIPAWAKLAAVLSISAATAVAAFVFWQRGLAWPRELAALLLFGLVLAGIALIGQVYQLQSAPWHALLLWLGLATPFLALVSTTRLAGALWAAAAVTTWFACYDPLVEMLVKLALMPKAPTYFYGSYVATNLMGWLPSLLLILLGGLRQLWPPAAAQGGLLATLGIAGLALETSLAASLGPTLFREQHEGGILAVAAVATVAVAVALHAAGGAARDRRLPVFLAASYLVWAIGVFPLGPSALSTDLLRALLFIVYWAAIGWFASRVGSRLFFGVAFTLIALRLLVLYFEAIGGLTATGLGLIGGGVICLLLAALGWRMMRGLASVRETAT